MTLAMIAIIEFNRVNDRNKIMNNCKIGKVLSVNKRVRKGNINYD